MYEIKFHICKKENIQKYYLHKQEFTELQNWKHYRQQTSRLQQVTQEYMTNMLIKIAM